VSRQRVREGLHGAARLCLGLAVLANVLAFIGQVAATGNIWLALGRVLAWFNPGNTQTFVTEVLLFSPAVFAYLLAEYLERTG
jgi:hypothetical protein